MARARIKISVGGRSFLGTVGVCERFVFGVMEEVMSDLNRHGAQLRFGVCNPSLQQLVDNYIYSGGLQRYLDRQPSSFVSEVLLD